MAASPLVVPGIITVPEHGGTCVNPAAAEALQRGYAADVSNSHPPHPPPENTMRKFPLLTLPVLLGAALAAQAQDTTPATTSTTDNHGDQIETRLDNKGDRIDQRLDEKGQRIDQRRDALSERQAELGHDKRAGWLDNSGNRIEDRLDNQGDRIDQRLDRRGEKINTCLDAGTCPAGDGVEDRLDNKGDRIDQRLDDKGQRIDQRRDSRSAHQDELGNEKRADWLDNSGDRVETRLDQKGDRVNKRLDRKGSRRGGRRAQR